MKVDNDDVLSFKNNNSWLIHHPKKAIIFAEPDSVWKQLRPAYNTDFKNLVFGDFPKDTEVFATLNKIKERLSTIEWKVNIEG